jgi:hypothetical protein
VVEVLDRCVGGGVEPTPLLARTVTRLALWCLVQRISLDVELVLDPDTVERYCSVGLTSGRSRGTYRSLLRKIGPLVTSNTPWAPPPPSICERRVAIPYTALELAALRRDASHQATAGRRRAATALIALGAGAGLDGRWSTQVTGDDVLHADSVLLIRVGEPSARLVPVLAEFEDDVTQLSVLALQGEALIGGFSTAKNRASDLAGRIETSHSTPKLSAARLRSTWLAMHLRLGTRLPELAAAAGLTSVTVLSDLLVHVEPLGDTEAWPMLRGAR